VSVTFTETSWFHDLSPFVSVTFMICVHDFPRGEILVKVGVVEFGLNRVGKGSSGHDAGDAVASVD